MEVRLLLLGSPELWLGGQRLSLPTRKLLGLLAYLALEGPTPRSKLANLLWDTEEERARANLRGEVYRLKKAAVGEILQEDHGKLALHGVHTDLEEFERLCAGQHWAEAAPLYRGPLLEGLSLEDAPEFEGWLQLARERWEERYNALLLGQARQFQQQERGQQALECYQQLLERDPLREEVWRESMQLLAKGGQAAKALEQYHRYAAFLERELGLAPTRETRLLAEEIRTGQTITPLWQSAQSPLAGRQSQWQFLQQAWRAGKLVLIRGEAGVGKTRLMLDFIAFMQAQGEQPELLVGRPGDSGVPFASITRLLQRALKRLSPQELTPWVKRELSRLLPELESGESPTPMQSEEDRLRLFSAISAFLKTGLWGSDDLQFLDGASLEFLDYQVSQQEGTPMLVAYRKGELSPRGEALVQGQLAAGRAVLLELEPLEESGVKELLSGLELPQPALHLAQPLHRLTGGNPLFVLETLKSLTEQGRLGLSVQEFELEWRGLPRQKIQAVIEQRLDRLSPAARDLLRLAAVAGQSFSLRLAKALGNSPLALAEASDELENAGLLRGQRFTHDLLLEATLHTIQASTRRLLHGEILGVLAQSGQGTVSAAVLALHAVGSGEAGAILEWSLKAAEEARQLAAWPEALHQLEQALQALGQAPDPRLELEIRLEREEIFHHTADRQAQAEELALLTPLALGPGLRSELAYRRGRLAYAGGDFERAARHYRQSNNQAAKLALVYTLEHLGISEGAREAALEVFTHPDSPENAFQAAILLAELDLERADIAGALGWYDQAEAFTARHPLRQVRFLRSKARFLYHSGDALGAIALGRQGIALVKELRLPGDEIVITHNLAVALNSAHRILEALATFNRTETLAKRLGMQFLLHSAQTHQGLIHIRLGNFAQAVTLIATPSSYAEHYRAMLLALALIHQGEVEQARNHIQTALPALGAHIWHAREARYVAALVETRAGNHAQSEALLRETLQTPEPSNLELCQALLAFNLLCQNRPAEALEFSRQANSKYPHIQADLPIQHVAWIHAQVLCSLGHTAEAQITLQSAHQVLRQSLEELPEAQQAIYMQAFVYNQGILAALEGRWPDPPSLL